MVGVSDEEAKYENARMRYISGRHYKELSQEEKDRLEKLRQEANKAREEEEEYYRSLKLKSNIRKLQER